ncbi:MAG: hypothetical protein J3R72DRAFT_427430 [Linnemannia gamsii]|nr:MAG: hypothetical protein J3R72DRAFT_427430 [Linnemannia gamsii]
MVAWTTCQMGLDFFFSTCSQATISDHCALIPFLSTRLIPDFRLHHRRQHVTLHSANINSSTLILPRFIIHLTSAPKYCGRAFQQPTHPTAHSKSAGTKPLSDHRADQKQSTAKVLFKETYHHRHFLVKLLPTAAGDLANLSDCCCKFLDTLATKETSANQRHLTATLSTDSGNDRKIVEGDVTSRLPRLPKASLEPESSLAKRGGSGADVSFGGSAGSGGSDESESIVFLRPGEMTPSLLSE